MNYEIREMNYEDGTAVLDIFQQSINRGTATFESDVPNWENWNRNYFQHVRWVIENEKNDVIGWAALRPASKQPYFSGVAVVSIYINNEYQGRGLGTVLLRKLILDSEKHGFWTLESAFFPENRAYLTILTKLGFREVGIRKQIARLNGIWRDLILVERRSRVTGQN